MKTFTVETEQWIDKVDVNDELFETYESQAQEAISLSLEKWLSSDDELAIGVLVATWDTKKGPSAKTTFLMNTQHVFENIGRPDMAKAIDKAWKDR